MNVQRVAGVALALGSCWPVWQALVAVRAGDHLGALIGLLLAWVLARAGLELTSSAPGGVLRGPGGDP